MKTTVLTSEDAFDTYTYGSISGAYSRVLTPTGRYHKHAWHHSHAGVIGVDQSPFLMSYRVDAVLKYRVPPH